MCDSIRMLSVVIPVDLDAARLDQSPFDFDGLGVLVDMRPGDHFK